MNSISFNGREIVPSKVVCIGKNYSDHVREMGDKKAPSEPVIFLKPNSAIVYKPSRVHIHESFGVLHHEIELCFMVGRSGKDIVASAAGIDFTLREKQAILKKEGHPWEISKGFDSSAVFGEFFDVKSENDLLNLDISLKVNGNRRQNSNTGNMIFKPREILVYVSKYMSLEEGDIFMCGTPSGVGPVVNGDEIEAEITGLPVLRFKVER